MICKIWPIKSGKKSLDQGIKASIKYITDKKKTEIQYDFDAENSMNDVSSALRYVKNDEKTKKIYVSGYMCSPETAAEEFAFTKMINLSNIGKELEDDSENQAFHIVQSFPDNLDISDEEVHQCGIDLVKKLGKYQAVIASHVEPVIGKDGKVHGKAKHNHILINSHMNPEFIAHDKPEKMKYHDCKATYQELRRLNDEVAIEHGLLVIESKPPGGSKSWYEYEAETEGKSWKKQVKGDIEAVKKCTSSWAEFVKLMEKYGYEIHDGKHETYITPDNHRVRGSTLGELYTRKSLEAYWEWRRKLEYGSDRNNQYEAEIEEEALKNTLKYLADAGAQSIYRPSGWTSSKSNEQYFVGLYDEDGNRRTLLEQIFILAYVVIIGESPEYLASKVLETNNEQEEFTLSKETERRLADIKSALNAVREEHISTEEELSEKINELGKQISRLKRKIKVNDEIKEKMLPIADLVAVIGVEEVSEERIKTIKRELLKYDITTDDEIENFKMRFKECKRLETEFPGRLQRMSERYTKLKKAAHQLELAKDRDYCYGLKKEYESYEIMR